MKKNKTLIILLIVFGAVFITTVLFLFLFEMFNISDDRSITLGTRVAAIFVSFASFIAQSLFSLLIYTNNRSINLANKDANTRAELFRDLQFISNNYSIIEFLDRMLIYNESDKYVNKVIEEQNHEYHMVHEDIKISDVYDNPTNYNFLSVKIPFRVIEGKVVGSISMEKITFERENVKYRFLFANRKEMETVLLFNEFTRRRNMIINLIVEKDNDFFNLDEISKFDKIKMRISITSVLGVRLKGISELFFSNPNRIEEDFSNNYKINSSTFTITETPGLTIASYKSE